MNILFISRAYGIHAGGMEALSAGLIASFPDAKRIVHETKPGKRLLVSRIHSLLFAISILPRAIVVSKDVDFVHIGDPVLSGIGWLIMKVRSIPVAVTVHGLDVSYKNPLYQLYLSLFFSSFPLYIAISDYASSLLASRKLGGKVVVIPPGLHDSIYDPTKTRNDLGKLLYRNVAHRQVFLTTGRLVHRKGHAWFIEHVLPKLPRTVLYVIAGDGPERERLVRLIASRKLEERVLLLGRVSEHAKKILLNTCDAFIQPNIPVKHDAEGFGIAPVEAALCGRPVFASNIDGIPSAIHQRKNGILLPPKETTAWVEALTLLIHNPKSFEPSGHDARAYTKAVFDWKSIARRYNDAFQEVL